MDLLKAARLRRGLKQIEVVARLDAQARARGDLPPTRSSLARMLGRWENGDPVSERYQTLFFAVYHCDPVELGFSDASIGDPHRVTPPRPNTATAGLDEAAEIVQRMQRLTATYQPRIN